MTAPLLFTPLALRGLTLKNRVVVAPMHQYAGERGFATRCFDGRELDAIKAFNGQAAVAVVVVDNQHLERRCDVVVAAEGAIRTAHHESGVQTPVGELGKVFGA